MFDLIDESGEDLKRMGYKVKEVGKSGICVASLCVDNDQKSKKLSLPKGQYFLINAPHFEGETKESELLSRLVADRLKILFENLEIDIKKKILIVGLGNPEILSDCLGKFVVDNICFDPMKKENNVFKFCPNIFFSTGINTFDMVAILVKGLEIDSVIVIDSLATHSLERLGKSFQMSSGGMTPGSGVNRLGKRISLESIGVPCISIGVPFMVYASAVGQGEEPLLLTPKDIHEDVKKIAMIIANAINKILFWEGV